MGLKIFLTLRQHWQHKLLLWSYAPTGICWNSPTEKWLRHGSETILCFLIVITLVSFWIPDKMPSINKAIIVAPRPIMSDSAMADKIIAAHLFGQAPVLTQAVATIDQSITVDGIVYASDSKYSQTVLTIDGKTDVYKDNQALPDGEIVTAIEPTDIVLMANSTSRHLSIPQYGDPDSEGPAAYAALLHGTGLSTQVMASAQANMPSSYSPDPAESYPNSTPIPLSNMIAIPSAQIVQISPTATPLQQLQTLRTQLIH